MVRKIHGKMPSVSIKHLNYNNTLITDLNEIVNTMAMNFSKNSSSTNYTAKFQQFKTSKEKYLVNFNSNNLEHYNRLFSKQELIDAIHQSTDTAVGSDDIHYQFLKHLPEISLELLLIIFNNIWIGGIFPSIWQEAILIPVLKPGKDDADPNSYRPIALTSCVCKILERMINKRLVYYLESNYLLTDIQSGFRKQRCTTDQLVQLETWVREGLTNGEHVVAVFFDLEKAYDTTWKHGNLADLFEAGLRGRLPIFLLQGTPRVPRASVINL